MTKHGVVVRVYTPPGKADVRPPTQQCMSRLSLPFPPFARTEARPMLKSRFPLPLPPPAAATGRSLRPACGQGHAGPVRRLLRRALPAAQAGHGGHPRVRHGRHGELGLRHLPRGEWDRG